MAKFWLIIAAILTTLGLLYSRTDHAPRADLVYVNSSGIHTLDPVRMSWTPDFRVALNIWEGLTSWDPRTNEVIGAASLFPPHLSEDGLTYRFTIRDDARWSNGDPVTSYDFVRGWRRAMEPGSAADYSFLLTKHIAGAAAYVRWRREGVAVLTALERMCGGSSLSSPQEETLLRASSFMRVFAKSHSESDAPGTQESSEPRDLLFAPGAIDRSRWCAIATTYFDNHITELEQRFLGVGLETPDANKLIVHLTSPCSYFTDITGLPVFLPCHEGIERLRIKEGDAPLTREGLVIHDPQWTKPNYHANEYSGLITNGAYRLDSWTFKRNLLLAVNPYYRDAAQLACRTVEMRVYDNTNAALMAYAAGDVDFLPAMSVPYDHEIARLARSGERPDFHLCNVMATYFLLFNCADAVVNGAPNPFVDPRVRKAFALSVNKTLLVENVLARGDRVAHSFVPPSITSGYETPYAPEYDPEHSRSLIRHSAALIDGVLPPIDFLCTQRDQRLVQAIARQWEQNFNVEVNIRVLETKTFAEEKAHRRFMISTGNWYADYLDPTSFLDCLTTGSGNNDSGYSNSNYDALLDRAARRQDAGARLRLLAKAESIIVHHDTPLIPILHYSEPIAIRKDVRGLYPNVRLWFPFRLVDTR